MEESIFIGATRHMDILHERLHEQLKPLAAEGLQVKMEKNPDGKFTFVACNFIGPGAGHKREYFRTVYLDNVANAICEIILNHWEKVILENIIRETYYYFNPEERDAILSLALEHISGSEKSSPSFYRHKRKRKILNEISQFLRTSNYIVIDGFIRFRLKDYVNELYEVAEQAVDEFLMEREYREFIQLLKYFVDIQEPRVNCVNVIRDEQGSFTLYDEKGDPIDNNHMEEFMIEFISSEINYEDLLISSLVTVAPNEIVLHFEPAEKQRITVDTIKKVFPGKVRHCRGCSLCQQ
jgi:putative sporulation protein YtxC